MNRSEIPHWTTESSTGWCTTRIASRCVGTPCVKRKERRRKSECIGGPKAVEKTGERRPWKSQERFPLSHSFNNNKLDDRDHFQQNAKTSVASLRGLIGSSRNTDRHHSGMLIDFIGIPKWLGLQFPPTNSTSIGTHLTQRRRRDLVPNMPKSASSLPLAFLDLTDSGFLGVANCIRTPTRPGVSDKKYPRSSATKFAS